MKSNLKGGIKNNLTFFYKHCFKFKTVYYICITSNKKTMKEITWFLLLFSTYIINVVVSYNLGKNKGANYMLDEYNTLHEKYIKSLKDHAQFIRDLRK